MDRLLIVVGQHSASLTIDLDQPQYQYSTISFADTEQQRKQDFICHLQSLICDVRTQSSFAVAIRNHLELIHDEIDPDEVEYGTALHQIDDTCGFYITIEPNDQLWYTHNKIDKYRVKIVPVIDRCIDQRLANIDVVVDASTIKQAIEDVYHKLFNDLANDLLLEVAIEKSMKIVEQQDLSTRGFSTSYLEEF